MKSSNIKESRKKVRSGKAPAMNSLREQMVPVYVVTIDNQILLEPGKPYFRAYKSEQTIRGYLQKVREQNANCGEVSKIIILSNRVTV